MDVTLVLVGIIVMTIVYASIRRMSHSQQFEHIPGPKEAWLLGNSLQIKPKEFHLQVKDWSKQFGSIYKLRLPGTYMIVISGFDGIYEGLHNTGLDLAGRYSTFRVFRHFRDTPLITRFPDSRWKSVRKLIHTQLKQYGEGMKKVENIIAEISEDMFSDFNTTSMTNSPLDPLDILKRTAFKIMAFVLCGKRLNDDDLLISSFLKYDDCVWQLLGDPSPDAILLDLFPPAVDLPLRSSRRLRHTDNIRDSVAKHMQQLGLNHEGSLIRILHQQLLDEEEGASPRILNKNDIREAPVNLALAGTGTSSVSFYCLMNILAHRKDVQNEIWREIRALNSNPLGIITLDNRLMMPYSRAVILDLLRYHTVAAVNTPRLAVKDTTIRGIRIPEGAAEVFNILALHYDPEFWEQPDNFQLERFLDSDGNLLPPDHPRRKHRLPFLSGGRGCPAEPFAVARLFLWLTNLIKRFEIVPAQANDESKVHPDNSIYSFFAVPSQVSSLAEPSFLGFSHTGSYDFLVVRFLSI